METGNTEINDDIFAEINEVVEVVAVIPEVPKEETIDIPEALQVCQLIEGKFRDSIVDTYKCNREHSIVPISKAKNKAECLKRIFPKNTYVVVAVIHKINRFKKIEKVYNILHTY